MHRDSILFFGCRNLNHKDQTTPSLQDMITNTYRYCTHPKAKVMVLCMNLRRKPYEVIYEKYIYFLPTQVGIYMNMAK